MAARNVQTAFQALLVCVAPQPSCEMQSARTLVSCKPSVYSEVSQSCGFFLSCGVVFWLLLVLELVL